MRYFLLALSVLLLGTTAVIGTISAYDGFQNSGSGTGSVLFFSLPLLATVVAGGFALRRQTRRSYRVNLVAAIASLGFAILTINSLGAYFVAAGLVAVLAASVLLAERKLASPR